MSSTIQARPPVRHEERIEAPYLLTEAAPRTLGFLDQFSLWGNLGISLTLPVLAPFLLTDGSSVVATVVAVLVGVLLGSLILALTAVPGAATGAPAMVLLRGLLGTKLSYLPTVLNIAQCIGWAVVEILVIATAAQSLTSPSLRWVFIVLAGAAATGLAVFPLTFIKRLRKYLVVVVLIASAYLFISVLHKGVGPWTTGNWTNFWPSVDLIVGLAVSWAPLAADYSRHSRSRGAAFAGTFLGWASGGAVYLLLGVFAFAGMADKDGNVTTALLAVPVAGLALAILAIDEVDEAFANVYSTAISTQNILPRLDRRVLAASIGALATGIALVVDLQSYETFLYLLGAIFVPLAAVLIVTFFTQRRPWDTSANAPARPWLLLPWAVGFAAYQLVQTTELSTWWEERWGDARTALHFTKQLWMSASLLSFAVAGVATLVVLRLSPER